MKRNILLLLIMSLICYSCTRNRKLVYDNKANHYEVSYHKNFMVISCVNHGKIEQKDTLLRKNEEYVDMHTKQVVLTVKRKVETVLDSLNQNYLQYYWKEIHKLRDYNWTPDLKEYHQDIYVTIYYIGSPNICGDRQILQAYYYDKNYKLLKIVKKTKMEYNAVNL